MEPGTFALPDTVCWYLCLKKIGTRTSSYCLNQDSRIKNKRSRSEGTGVISSSNLTILCTETIDILKFCNYVVFRFNISEFKAKFTPVPSPRDLFSYWLIQVNFGRSLVSEPVVSGSTFLSSGFVCPGLNRPKETSS